MAKRIYHYEAAEAPSAISVFFKSIFGSLKNAVAEGAENIIEKAERRVLLLQKKMTRTFVVTLCEVASVAALILGLCFYLRDVLLVSRHIIFISVGIILLMIAFFLPSVRSDAAA